MLSARNGASGPLNNAAGSRRKIPTARTTINVTQTALRGRAVVLSASGAVIGSMLIEMREPNYDGLTGVSDGSRCGKATRYGIT